MALSLQLGFSNVPNSITNPNVTSTDAIDVGTPMSFLTFIKLIKVSYEPDSLQEYYNYYLKTWNNKVNTKEEDHNILIVDKYRDFLKDISLNYTTPEEKQFLSKIDFNDPYDLDVAIGFYGKKLTEISKFYNDKRNDVKFNVTRNKLKGTNFGTEKTILELTLSYLKNLDDGKMLYDYDDIKSKIEIEIEELYDGYPFYFNADPTPQVYDKKDLDYGYDIFLKTDTELITEIFSTLSEDLKILKEVDQIFENKRKLTKKYISTDFYYLSTGATVYDYTSGLLFKSDNPVGNFLNRNYPTTASTQQTTYLQSERETGFFRPSKIALVLVDGVNDTFSFNLSNLSPNSLYYFPDPTIIGSNGDIMTFMVDDTFLTRNYSSGNAINQPYSIPKDTKYYGYVSKLEPSHLKYLDSVFESGFIQDIKWDINNNLFGLFKKDHRFRQTIENISAPVTTNLIINGYEYYDDLYETGFSFDYFASDFTTFTETKRSGLSTNTGVFSAADSELSLFFGYFAPYNEIIAPTEANLVVTYEILEGAYISKYDYTTYSDTSSSDLSAYENDSGEYYYTDLIEGGLHTSSPLQRALSDISHPTLSGDLTQYIRGSALNIVDGGYLSDNINWNLEFTPNPYYFENSTSNPSIYTTDITPYSEGFALSGTLMVKNSYTRQVLPVLDALSYLSVKYDADIVSEIERNIQKFEISNDILFIETPNYLTINKILWENNGFSDPKTAPIYFEHSTGNYDKISNRFKKGNNIFFCKLQTLSATITDNDFAIYPEIYMLDGVNFKNTKIFPLSTGYITEFFNISGGDVRYTSADAPTITYNSRNNIFNISFLMKDQNNMPRLHKMYFIMNPNVSFTSHIIMSPSPDQISNIIMDSSTVTMFLTSGTIINSQEELIL